MTKGRWIFDKRLGELVPADEYRARQWEGTQVSNLPCPMVISDYLPDTKSMASGRFHDSKSALRKEYRERGYIEVGNEEMKPKALPKPDRKAIRDSIAKAASRVGVSALLP